MYRHIVRKGKNILVAFSDNCGYSSVILNQNSTSRGFQENSYHVEFEITLMNFHTWLHYSIGLSCLLNRNFTQSQFGNTLWKWKWKSLSCVQFFVIPWTIQYSTFLQARILQWVAIPFSRGSSQPGIEPRSPALQVDSLPAEPQGKPVTHSIGHFKNIGSLS